MTVRDIGLGERMCGDEVGPAGQRNPVRSRIALEKAEIVKKVGRKNGVAVEQCVHNAGHYPRMYARARARVCVFLYYLLYTRYATDRKDRGNKKYYSVPRCNIMRPMPRLACSLAASASCPLALLARTYFNCSTLLAHKVTGRKGGEREGR